MEKDLEKELKGILDKHEKEKKCCECEIGSKFCPPPYVDTGCGDWILMLVALGMLGDKSFLEPKQPIINIYLGGDK